MLAQTTSHNHCHITILIHFNILSCISQPFGPQVVKMEFMGTVLFSVFVLHSFREGLCALDTALPGSKFHGPCVILCMDVNGESPWWSSERSSELVGK